MMKIIDVKNGTGRFENVYYPVLDMDGESFACACITGNKDTDFGPVVAYLEDEIWDQFESENNYGLAFFACGYDGNAQQAFIQHCEERFGVGVF